VGCSSLQLHPTIHLLVVDATITGLLISLPLVSFSMLSIVTVSWVAASVELVCELIHLFVDVSLLVFNLRARDTQNRRLLDIDIVIVAMRTFQLIIISVFISK